MDAVALFAAGAGAGLLAGATSCAAAQLGLLAGAVRDAPHPLRPVAAFLASKLAVHTLLGAALGALGGVVQPGPRLRGVLMLAAAAALVALALNLIGLRPARRPANAACAPHAHGKREPDTTARHRRRVPRVGSVRQAEARASWRPGAVAWGAATVVVPCGVTLSVELLAVASGSAAGGAAVMAGFVLGTVPVFAVAGVAVRRVVRGRFAVVPVVAMLVVAAWTAAAGLRLAGWLPEGGGTARADAARFVRVEPDGTQIVTVWALDGGYRPALLDARAGLPTVLELRTRGAHGHTRVFTVPERGLDVRLPADGVTRVPLGVPGPGRMRFVCASGHYPGAITFR
ncbi:sulfite exporter TauE/SafE family protein [Actinomadura flavalba]|uniref:urease accessory protein UreH domain-containing protein n=1 Tax=Actinomadura flavalba TaxID=1120938 RepID=UPI00036CED5B|nr:sulfite exporter TauE/SafE family protein [Actinomadura flavalba]